MNNTKTFVSSSLAILGLALGLTVGLACDAPVRIGEPIIGGAACGSAGACSFGEVCCNAACANAACVPKGSYCLDYCAPPES